MTRVRQGLGYLAAAWIILSSAMHSILGWKELRASLEKAKVPADLSLGIEAGWHFAGVAMLCLGILAIAALRARQRTPLLVTGAGYVLFGAWALAISGGDPFFLMFLVPGLLLLAAIPAR